jgi:hypothetical protein
LVAVGSGVSVKVEVGGIGVLVGGDSVEAELGWALVQAERKKAAKLLEKKSWNHFFS